MCNGEPPALGQRLFFSIWLLDLLLQLWIISHTNWWQTAFRLVLPEVLKGSFLSLLGRFDSYSDIFFTAKILKCEEITWFSFHFFGTAQVWTLPFGLTLSQIAVFAAFVGVLCCQALPGLFLLLMRRQLPLAFKFNEFNLLLEVMAKDRKNTFQ
mmetsp:Transcript_11533/g.20424  ORF Transcript_11533/g.20424 Transcript_11533/m.20424 type:complete len:154 (-) Transcript_11533:47-508(-)